MKRKIDNHYIVLALASVLITIIGVVMSYQNRGYWAVGGEVFIVPLIFMIRFIYREVKREWGI